MRAGLLLRIARMAGWTFAALLSLQQAAAQRPTEVAWAGLAYAGDAAAVESRFPYTHRLEKQAEQAGTPLAQAISQPLVAAAPPHLKIVPQIDRLQGRDQALAVALVIGSEITSVERFGDRHKLTALVRGQAMYFDFKSMNVVRSYPVSFAYIDVLDRVPTAAEILQAVGHVYYGTGGKPGLFARFIQSVARAEIPSHVPRYLQVTGVQVTPEVLELLPAYLRSSPDVARTWAADLVGEAISTRANVPLVPYAKGYAIGNVMSMRISDGTVLQLKLPQPDYEIRVDLTGLRKVKFSEMPGGATSFVYGAYAQLQIEEPVSRQTYFASALKNGETRVVPASQATVDDFPHYYDAVNGLFVKLAQLMNQQGDEKWLRSAAAAPDIDQQMSKTRELLKTCR